MVNPAVAQLTLDWSDDFDDGNYDGWTVFDGAYAVTDGKLTVTAYGAGNGHPFIQHPSNSSFGNWSFDVTIIDHPDPDDHAIVCVMSSHRSILGGPIDSSFILEWRNRWNLYRETQELGWFTAERDWKHHIRLERQRAEPNTVYVYHNDTLVLEEYVLVPDLDYAYFGWSASIDSSIDNITVEHEPEIVTTTTTPDTTTTTTTDDTTPPPDGTPLDMTMILVIGGGVVVVLVIVAVVKMR
jgi:hypothetical protein